MSRSKRRVVVAGFASGLLATGALSVVGCEEDYPLEPTFCDDWCRAVRTNCDPPANCVRDCELTRSSDDCFPLQEELLGCYEDNAGSIECRGEGFADQAVAVDHVCRDERDALFECEAPGIGSCLALCRQEQERQIDEIVDAPVSAPTTDPSDAGADAVCPRLDESCEAICWTLFSFNSEGLAQAGVEVESEGPAASDASAGSDDELVPGIADCVQEALLGCFASAVGIEAEGPEGENSSDDESLASQTEPATISEVLSDCSFERGE